MSDQRPPDDPPEPRDPFAGQSEFESFGQATFDPPPPSEPEFPAEDQRNDWIEQADAHDLPTRENRLAMLGRFAFPPAPPLDEEGLAARDHRWTGRIVVVATLFLLVFNAASIQSWASTMKPGWGTQTIRQLSNVWSAQLVQTGADQPRQVVRDNWEAAREARYPELPVPAKPRPIDAPATP